MTSAGSYAETLRVMQHGYPTLFPYEWDALSHLFLCLGNGYEWFGGELRPVFEDSNDPDETIRRIVASHIAQETAAVARGDGRTKYAAFRLELLQQPIEVQWAATIEYRRGLLTGLRVHPGAAACWRLHPDGTIAVHGRFHPSLGSLADFPKDATASWHGALRRLLDYIHDGHIFIDDGKRVECIEHVVARLT